MKTSVRAGFVPGGPLPRHLLGGRLLLVVVGVACLPQATAQEGGLTDADRAWLERLVNETVQKHAMQLRSDAKALHESHAKDEEQRSAQLVALLLEELEALDERQRARHDEAMHEANASLATLARSVDRHFQSRFGSGDFLDESRRLMRNQLQEATQPLATNAELQQAKDAIEKQRRLWLQSTLALAILLAASIALQARPWRKATSNEQEESLAALLQDSPWTQPGERERKKPEAALVEAFLDGARYEDIEEAWVKNGGAVKDLLASIKEQDPDRLRTRLQV